ncbi:MAG: HEAT repeat domain-containing protein [Acidobacteria bacterium]|nr:HEAT repeat domain-containing protein [Acidobacteriota bacterium]MBU4307838.1 HEAT repeat domain-containing protein [Acidobacteriota bacterium]MCG2811369.1 HEAT repeat domain-containing protein [Candidatus Aminicenantes bacterium]
MNCQEMKKMIPDLLQNGLESGQDEHYREHLHSCPACWQEWQDLHETWTRLGILPEEQPGPELRRNFYRQLEASRREMAAAKVTPWRQHWRRLLPDWRYAFPAMRLAAAVLVVVVGFGIGFMAGGSRENGGKFARLNKEVERLQQQVSLSLLSQPSAAARLQGLSMTSRLQDPDPTLLKMLLDVLDNDPSVNVRLSAVDALYLFADREQVRAALTASLSRQASPLVQIALIDLMVSFKEKRAAAALKKLLDDKQLIPEVRQRAKSGISQIL